MTGESMAIDRGICSWPSAQRLRRWSNKANAQRTKGRVASTPVPSAIFEAPIFNVGIDAPLFVTSLETACCFYMSD